MKTDRRGWMALTAAGLFAALSGCGGGGSSGAAASAAAAGRQRGDLGAGAAQLNNLPLEALSEAERDGLLAMREEEQLAHDVYAASAVLWTALPIFGQIANSETRHAAAVADLLDRYAVPDPMDGVAAGVFPTPAYQALFDALSARSGIGLIEALQVGCEIEELDMRDIAEHLLAVDNADIRTVYENLLRGSRNHLRSFYATLQQQGGSYIPLYLSQEAFDAIVNSAMEVGG